MADIDKLKDILARVEKATGPDREVDAAVWLDTTPGATWFKNTVRSSTGAWPDYVIDETRDETRRLVVVPAYTASLDACVALAERVLPDCYISIGAFGGPTYPIDGKIHPRTCEAIVEVPGYSQYGNVTAKTMPLAFLAAILRALIAKESAHAKEETT